MGQGRTSGKTVCYTSLTQFMRRALTLLLNVRAITRIFVPETNTLGAGKA